MTTEAFADEHATIEAAHRRICATEEQIYAALARIPKPPGATTRDDDEWSYSERAGAYTRDVTMGHWDVAGDESGRVRAEVDLYVEQTETGALREWSIYLDGQGLDEMTADDARRLAATLLDAATTLEASRSNHSEPDA